VKITKWNIGPLSKRLNSADILCITLISLLITEQQKGKLLMLSNGANPNNNWSVRSIYIYESGKGHIFPTDLWLPMVKYHRTTFGNPSKLNISDFRTSVRETYKDTSATVRLSPTTKVCLKNASFRKDIKLFRPA
jgi:hypothetical protein